MKTYKGIAYKRIKVDGDRHGWILAGSKYDGSTIFTTERLLKEEIDRSEK